MLKKIIIISLFYIISFSGVLACRYEKKEYSEIYKNSPDVIVGRLELIKDDSEYLKKYKIIIEEVIKGKIDKNKEIFYETLGTSCDFYPGSNEKEYWVLFGKYDKEYFQTWEPKRNKSFFNKEESLKFVNSLKEEDKNSIIENKKDDGFKGPVGKPFVKGPTSPPPTNEEILAMRGIKTEESFWNKIWNWILNLFK